MKIALSAEATCDLTPELLKEFNVNILPFKVVLKDATYNDGDITTEEIFKFVDETGVLPKTTAINQFEYQEYFENLKKDYDAIIHIALSSGLSSSCQNAILASQEMENVFVIDSLALSTGIALQIIYARKLIDEGLDAKEIYEKLLARRENAQVSFVVERLDYLHKGGRCSSLALLGANILKIRPRIVMKDGRLSSDKKYKGKMESVVEKYCTDTLAEFSNIDKEIGFVTYTTATPEMVNVAVEALKSAGFKRVEITRAGCTIASHCGGNTLGILYFNDGE
ncbi:MAG: DegV family protein [Clostridiales bacterium]|nr:DegV family protein [Clostridiales bacterium]